MLDQINGLPGHILLVHAVVVLIPLTCLLLVLAAVSPRLRDRIGIALPLLAVVSLALVPLTVSAGHWLERRIGSGPLVEKHERLGEGLLKYVIALLVLAFVVYALGHLDRRSAPEPVRSKRERVAAGSVAVSLPLRVVLAVACIAVAAATVLQVVRVGDSGSKAVWTGVSQTP